MGIGINLNGTKNKFTKAKGVGKHPYDEPTFLSFFLMFDWVTSPLFNGTAVSFLRDVYKDEARALNLEKFIKYLKKINKEMPWFFQSISGLEVAHTYGKMEDPFAYSDANIEISCLETLDFTMAGIFDLYKNVAVDTDRMVEVLPHNLTYFNVYVHVQEIRNFVPFIGADSTVDQVKNFKGLSPIDRKNVLDKNNLFNEFKDRIAEDSIDWKSKDLGPRFITKLGKCCFSIDNGAAMFSTISNNAIETPVTHTLKFKYQSAIMKKKEYLTAFNHTDDDLLSGFDNEIIKDMAAAGLKAVNDIADQGIAKAEGFANNYLEDLKNKLLLGNVYGANTLSNIQDAINSGSINALGPLFKKKEDPSIDPEIGAPIGERIYPESAVETKLQSTKIFGDGPEDSEKILSPENIHPTIPAEQDLSPENIHPTIPAEQDLSPENIHPTIPAEQDSNLGNVITP